jgi:hypothetical protein
MEEPFTSREHSTPIVPSGRTQFLSVSQCTSVITVNCVPLLPELHYQHSPPVPENSCHQLSGRQRLFKLFDLFSGCVCIHSFDPFLVSKFTSETQVSLPVTLTM